MGFPAVAVSVVLPRVWTHGILSSGFRLATSAQHTTSESSVSTHVRQPLCPGYLSTVHRRFPLTRDGLWGCFQPQAVTNEAVRTRVYLQAHALQVMYSWLCIFISLV